MARGHPMWRRPAVQVYARKAQAVETLTRPQAAPNTITDKGQEKNILAVGLVNVLTEALRVLGVGRERYEEVRAAPPPADPLEPGDVAGLMQRLRSDYERAYFVTGLIDTSIYTEDCFFADPTVQFRGVSLWQRNLQLLVPFLIRPSIDLISLKHLTAPKPQSGSETTANNPLARLFSALNTSSWKMTLPGLSLQKGESMQQEAAAGNNNGSADLGSVMTSSRNGQRAVATVTKGEEDEGADEFADLIAAAGGREVLRAEWYLSTVLALPWRPLVALRGATVYTLNEQANQIAEHVEYWSISGTEALLMLFKPGPREAQEGAEEAGR